MAIVEEENLKPGAEALASTLRALNLDNVSAVDVEWMYSYPEAAPFLNAVASTFSAGADACVLPEACSQGEDVLTELPAEYRDYILAALPPSENCESGVPTQSPSEAAAEAKRTALARVEALREQKALFSRLLAAASAGDVDDDESENDAGCEDESADISHPNSALLFSAGSELRGAAATLALAADSTSRWAADYAATVDRAIGAYQAAEASVYDSTLSSALSSWQRASPSAEPRTPPVAPIADAVADASVQRTQASIALARATGALQALRSGGDKAGGFASIERALEKLCVDAGAAEGRAVKRAEDEARAYVLARAKGVEECARMRAAEERVRKGRECAAIVGRAVGRVAVAAEVLREVEKRYRDGLAQVGRLYQTISEVNDFGKTTPLVERGESGIDGAERDEVLRCRLAWNHVLDAETRLLQIDDEAKKAEEAVEKEVRDVARGACDEVKKLVFGAGTEVERSEVMARGLREARGSVSAAGTELGDLMEEKRGYEDNTDGVEGRKRGVWMRFFAVSQKEAAQGGPL